MKPRFLKFRNVIVAVIAAIFAQCMSSCSGDDDDFVAWDYDPVSVYFTFVDKDGNDLIAKDGSLYQSNISVVYLKETYEAKWYSLSEEYENEINKGNQNEPELGNSKSRALLAILYGLYYYAPENGELSQLKFFELDGNLGIAVLHLVLPDGTTHEVVIKRRITNKVKQTVELDGKVIESLSNGTTYLEIEIVVE